MTRLSAKTLSKRNLYVLVIHFPGSRKRVATRRVSRRPFPDIHIGDDLQLARRTVVVRAIARRTEVTAEAVEHITEVFTRAASRKKVAANVVRMPLGDSSVVAEFLRYHVLVRVYDGDPDAWLAQLEARGDDGPDLRFVRWIRARLRKDPSLLGQIRRMVDATPFWRAAEA